MRSLGFYGLGTDISNSNAPMTNYDKLYANDCRRCGRDKVNGKCPTCEGCDCTEKRTQALCTEGGSLCHDDTCQQTGECILKNV
jgi:hypothetical protein